MANLNEHEHEHEPQPNKPLVIGIDPGKTTGVCVLQVNGFYKPAPRGGVERFSKRGGRWDVTVASFTELEFDDRFHLKDIIEKLSTLPFTDRAVVMESFNLYPGAAQAQGRIMSDFPSIQVIGMVQYVCNELGYAPPIMQPPSARKTVQVLQSDRRLISGWKHAVDAYKHARYYIVTRGHERGWALEPTGNENTTTTPTEP